MDFRKRTSKFISFAIICVLVVSFLIGCSRPTQSPANPTTQKTETKQEIKLPVKDPITLSYWCPLNERVRASYTDLGQTILYKELEKRTGVKVKFTHPPAGQEKEQFNLMIASNDLPDVIEWNWQTSYPGGPEKAIKDKVIIPLNDLLPKYAPLLQKEIQKFSSENLEKLIKTDDKNYFMFPFIRNDKYDWVISGPLFRKDWLDDLGMKVPATVDEYSATLTAFKQKKSATAPLGIANMGIFTTNEFLVGAYGTGAGFYIDGDKVKYGPIEPGYKGFLTTLNKWYKEGLIDPEFATYNADAYNNKITTNKMGAFVGASNSGIRKFTDIVRPKDPKFELIGGPYPVLKAGERPQFGDRRFMIGNDTCAAITPANKHKEITTVWLDYGYSDAGHMLFNFGIENESFKKENGQIKYTDLIEKNPEGLQLEFALAKYSRAPYNGAFTSNELNNILRMKYPEQKKALDLWYETDAVKHKMPPVYPTQQESGRMSSVMSQVDTYYNEMFLKFIMGQEPLDKYDSFVQQLKKIGIDEAIKIQQAAYERYKTR